MNHKKIESLKKEFKKEAVADIDESDIKKVYEYIESGNEQKIKKAIEVAMSNSELQSSIEKRYLILVRARLNNPDATIEDLSKDILKKQERRTFQSKYISKTFISYSYMSDEQTKLIVDFIGAMVKNHLDIEEFISKAKETSNEDELKTLFDKYGSKLKEDIQNEVEKYKEGWYGEICCKLLDMELEKVMFEKTSFYEANKSLVLREYMFFLGMIAEDRLYMDIYQSDIPEFTEVFWMLKEIPKTNWGDTEPNFPELSLSYKRDGIMRIGDDGLWVYILDRYPTFEYHSEEILLCDDGDHERAIESYTKALEKKEDGRGYYGRGLTYLGWNYEKYKLASMDFEKAAMLGVDVSDGYYSIGTYLFNSDCYKEGARYLTKSIESRKNNESYYYRCLCNRNLGMNREALNDIDSAIEIGGEKLKYLSVKALLLNVLNECEGAISLFNRVIKMEPSVDCYWSRGRAYRKLGKYQKTIEDFTAAIELARNKRTISTLLVLRADAYKSLNDMDNVWKDLHCAVEKDPDNAAVYLDTIELYITTCEYAKGLEYIKEHEKEILENCAEHQKLIFLYLKATILITLNMSIESFKKDINTLSNKGMDLEWNFSHTNKWLVESYLSQGKKDEIAHLTEVLAGKKKGK
ncbi:tetratricopeptide repeat protein [Vallitalea maricola]|uniref:Uncharacterized protein n=1 Tax=Vallitalea maricola TaxID=3074433 RepID=A0ACB5UMH9_9FIRM|nr:hypothetical protein AN2V17_30560 [Vallitalea sp. AN17-2]